MGIDVVGALEGLPGHELLLAVAACGFQYCAEPLHRVPREAVVAQVGRMRAGTPVTVAGPRAPSPPVALQGLRQGVKFDSGESHADGFLRVPLESTRSLIARQIYIVSIRGRAVGVKNPRRVAAGREPVGMGRP